MSECLNIYCLCQKFNRVQAMHTKEIKLVMGLVRIG